MKKVLFVLLTAVFMGVFGVGGYHLYLYYSESAQSDEIYSGLTDYVQVPDPTKKTPHPTGETDEDGEKMDSDIDWPEVDFQALREINPDIVGWLYCEDTVINYPVVQGSDNSYYLRHLFDGAYNANGCLFLDCRVNGDLSDAHSIIYGHHMKNGSMFSSLDGYKNQEYYEEHPQLLLVTPDANYVVELFAGYVASVEENAWTVGFTNEMEFEDWIVSAIEKSTFESSVTPLSSDRILTLSTCSYEFSDARFVVLGILKKYDTLGITVMRT